MAVTPSISHNPVRQASTRPLNKADLAEVARIHAAAFPDSALTKLGTEVVRRYYEWQLEGPHEIIALGCMERGELAGFCFAGVFHGAMSGFLGKNQGYLAARILTHPWLVTNPLIRERGMMSLRLLGGAKRGNPNSPAPVQMRKESFGVLAIAVHPSRQGGGFGQLMMDRVEAYASGLNFDQINLTVSPSNAQAIHFYQKMGWEKVLEQEDWGGRMIKKLVHGNP